MEISEKSQLVRLPRDDFQKAVREGFNPFRLPAIDMSAAGDLASAFGMTTEQTFRAWRQRVLDDPTDWALCSRCADAFREATKPVTATALKSVVRPRDYAALFESTFRSRNSSLRQAVESFEKEVASDADCAEKLFWRGAAWMILAGGETGSLNVERTMAVLKGNSSLTWSNPVDIHLTRAIDLFEEALRSDPKYDNAYSKLFGAYIAQKDNQALRRTAIRWAKASPNIPDAARKWLKEQEATVALPPSPEEAIAKSRQLYDDGKLDEAVELLEEVLLTWEGHEKAQALLSSVLSDRGAAQCQMGRPESGFRDFLRATQVNPRNYRALVNLSATAKERGDRQLALESAKKALALQPDLRSNAQFMDMLSTLEIASNQEKEPVSSTRTSSGRAFPPAKSKRWWEFWK